MVHISFLDNFLHLGLGASIAAGGLAARRAGGLEDPAPIHF